MEIPKTFVSGNLEEKEKHLLKEYKPLTSEELSQLEKKIKKLKLKLIDYNTDIKINKELQIPSLMFKPFVAYYSILKHCSYSSLRSLYKKNKEHLQLTNEGIEDILNDIKDKYDKYRYECS